MKRKIKLTECDLYKVIKESVKKIVKENIPRQCFRWCGEFHEGYVNESLNRLDRIIKESVRETISEIAPPSKNTPQKGKEIDTTSEKESWKELDDKYGQEWERYQSESNPYRFNKRVYFPTDMCNEGWFGNNKNYGEKWYKPSSWKNNEQKLIIDELWDDINLRVNDFRYRNDAKLSSDLQDLIELGAMNWQQYREFVKQHPNFKLKVSRPQHYKEYTPQVDKAKNHYEAQMAAQKWRDNAKSYERQQNQRQREREQQRQEQSKELNDRATGKYYRDRGEGWAINRYGRVYWTHDLSSEDAQRYQQKFGNGRYNP